MNASRHAPALLALCLLSAATAAGATTREPRMHGPGGDCSECAPADTAATPDAAPAATTSTTKPGAAPAVKPPAATQVKPAMTARSGSDDGNNVHAPRWHSFLPGMFR